MPGRDVDAMCARFSGVTRARIGLGRSGDALPTRPALDFQYAHACARDAVSAPLDFAALAAQLGRTPVLRVRSAAGDRSTYLRRPDLGRRLAGDDAARLPAGPWDAVFVIADGLSAGAVQWHAAPMFAAVSARLTAWSIGPVVIAEQARVGLGDEIGALMGAGMVVVLIGERPGLTVPNSLGAYLTYAPRVGRRDAERNCISNIHGDGLSYAAAAQKLAWLMWQARTLRLSGVELKQDAPAVAPELRFEAVPPAVAPGLCSEAASPADAQAIDPSGADGAKLHPGSR
jgi:ethanolamine ammonia-lyase small subunit